LSVFGALRSPQIVLMGNGQRSALPGIVALAGKRAFICTDNRFAIDEKLQALDAALRDSGVATARYEGTIPELPMSCIEEATEVARAFRPDVIIGIGGGSCLDLAKLVATGLARGGPLSQYYGEFKIPGPVLPVIAIPTTAGTGSEVTPVAVVGDPDRVVKVGISSPFLIPFAAICDPELTVSCPPGLTAVSGADALTHAIESFTAIVHPASSDLALRQVFVGKNAFSDISGAAAIKALYGNLAQAVENGSDAQARAQVMLGATLAGQAFGAAGTAAAHAIQYPVGALTHTAHGLGVACVMPYVMEFNRSAATTSMAVIADLIGVGAGLTEYDRAGTAIDAIEALFRRVRIPATLKELGLAGDRIDWVAEQAMTAARLVNNNPRQLNLESMKAIVSAAYLGDRSALRN
jgi:alcohol dehydrogenase class IV